MEIRFATPEDAGVVAGLVCRLLKEIVPETYVNIEPGKYEDTARTLLNGNHRFWAVLAFDRSSGGSGQPVSLMTLDEGHALYAHGRMGEIMEFFVAPEYRSQGVGEKMIAFAVAFGREQGWSILEVGAPDVPRWQRTVDFYRRRGFIDVGPRLEMGL